MKGIRNSRHSVVATASAVVIGLAGVLLFVRFQDPHRPDPSAPAPAAAVRSGPAQAGNTGNGVSGKGIPTGPGPGYSYSESAPAHPDAPTANLRKVADNLRVANFSVSIKVTLPRGLGLTNRVDVSVSFDDLHDTHTQQRVTQTYDNANGNRLFTNLPEGTGLQRRVLVIASLSDKPPAGDPTPYAVRFEVDLEPLYDVALGPLSMTLVRDCDGGSEPSEPHIYWQGPQIGKYGDGKLSLTAGGTGSVQSFALRLHAAGHSAQLGYPTFSFREDDPEHWYTKPGPRPPDKLTRALLPGKTQTVKFFIQSDIDYNCGVNVSYDITITLYLTPNL